MYISMYGWDILHNHLNSSLTESSMINGKDIFIKSYMLLTHLRQTSTYEDNYTLKAVLVGTMSNRRINEIKLIVRLKKKISDDLFTFY